MAIFEQTTPDSAEERFGEVAHNMLKTAKHEYKEAEKFGELTEGMRGWKLHLKDITPAFRLDRHFRQHFCDGKLMQLWEFVHFVHWMLTHYDDEKSRLLMLLELFTILFFHTKETEENDWHPFHRPLRELLDEIIDEEVQRRVDERLRILDIKKQIAELDNRR